MFIILIKLVLISHKNKINGRVRNVILCIILQIFNILFIKFLLKYNTWRTKWVSGVSELYSNRVPAFLRENGLASISFMKTLWISSLCVWFLGIYFKNYEKEVTFSSRKCFHWRKMVDIETFYSFRVYMSLPLPP